MKKTVATSKFPPANTIAIYSLGAIVGLLQVVIGSIALAPQIAPDYSRELKIHYNAFSKNLSFLHDLIDKVVLANYLRYLIASSQTLFGLFVIENGYFGKNYSTIGNYGLVGINLLVVTLQFFSGVSFERLAPTLVFLILLASRLVLIAQASKRTRTLSMKTRNDGKPKTSTPKKSKHD